MIFLYIISNCGIIFAAFATEYGLLEPHYCEVIILAALTALNLSVACILRR